MKNLQPTISRLFAGLAFFTIIHLTAAQLPTQGSQFFRVVGPSAVKITGFNPDGTIVWSNAIAGTNYTVQTITTTLTGDSNWVNYIQIAATNCINTNFIFNFNPPTNFPTNFPPFPTNFPPFPTNFPPVTFPTNFPPPATNPPDPGTNGTNSIVQQLAPGGDNDGNYDINEFDYHITALILSDVLTADPNGPAAILADGTKPATFFEPDDAQWVGFARQLSGQALPLPSAASEQAAYEILKGLGTDRLEKILTYHIIPGITLIPLAPPIITETTYTTANGETLLIKSDFGLPTLVDNNPLTPDSGVVEGAMNKGNRQVAWSSALFLPSTY